MPVRQSAVYVIKNLITNRVYVGSTNHVDRRLKSHRRELIAGTHGNEHLQRSWAKYGENSFSFSILETCEPDIRHKREQHWIDLLGAVDPEKGYNIMNLARQAAPSIRRSQISRKMWSDPEFAAAMSVKRQATGKDPAFRAKSSASAKALWETEEHRNKMLERDARLKANDGFREVRRKLASEQWNNPETRAKGIAASKAQWKDVEARNKILEAQAKGRIEKGFSKTMSDKVRAQWLDPEFRAKRIAALKAGQAKRKLARNEIVSSAVNMKPLEAQDKEPT